MVSKLFLNRMQKLIWVAIYGGLLAVVLATFLGTGDEALASCLTICGIVFVAIGALMIYLRSRMGESP
jgi:hypothetical protein